jgi:hypothetical protein
MIRSEWEMNMTTLTKVYSLSFFAALTVVGVLLAQTAIEERETGTHTENSNAQIRYAQAVLDLANVELLLTEHLNLKLHSRVDTFDIARKRDSVLVAQEFLKVAKQRLSEGDAADINLRYAQEKALRARKQYEQVLQHGQNAADSIAHLQLERLRLRADVAELRALLWSRPENAVSFLERLHWRMDRLSEEVVVLQLRVDELEQK